MLSLYFAIHNCWNDFPVCCKHPYTLLSLLPMYFKDLLGYICFCFVSSWLCMLKAFKWDFPLEMNYFLCCLLKHISFQATHINWHAVGARTHFTKFVILLHSLIIDLNSLFCPQWECLLHFFLHWETVLKFQNVAIY